MPGGGRVVEVVTGEWRRPVSEHAHEAAVMHVRHDRVFEHECDPEARERGAEALIDAVDG
jgi:hypothetical protein